MLAPTVEVTWDNLVNLEPKLAALLTEIQALRPRRGARFCAVEAMIRRDGYRARLSKLVGWYAEGAEGVLRTSTAYRVAYDVLYRALPHCRRCQCL